MRDLGYTSTYYIPDPIASKEGENDEKPIGYHGEKRSRGGAAEDPKKGWFRHQ